MFFDWSRPDNRYFGFLITAVVQIPGYIYVLLTLERPSFGRKRSMCAFLIISGICLFLHPLAIHAPLDPITQSWLRLSLSLVGRFCANCSYTILNLYSAEQFPTVVRSIGVGFTLVKWQLNFDFAKHTIFWMSIVNIKKSRKRIGF